MLHARDDRRLARRAAWRHDKAMAARRPGSRAGLPLQVQCGLSHRLLRLIPSGLDSRTGASQKTRPVPRPPDFRGLHPARPHLEFAERLDHTAPRRRQRRVGLSMAPDLALFRRISPRGSGPVESSFFRSCIVGDGGALETPPGEPAGAILLLYGRGDFPGTSGLLSPLPDFAQLDRARGAADVLAHGYSLGRTLACGHAGGQRLVARRPGARPDGRGVDP